MLLAAQQNSSHSSVQWKPLNESSWWEKSAQGSHSPLASGLPGL